MKAVGYQKPQAISQPESLIDITLPDPVATGRDLLVEVRAVSVNPVDTKVRASGAPAEGQTHKVLGWDASGIVKAVGPEVTLFKPATASGTPAPLPALARTANCTWWTSASWATRPSRWTSHRRRPCP